MPKNNKFLLYTNLSNKNFIKEKKQFIFNSFRKFDLRKFKKKNYKLSNNKLLFIFDNDKHISTTKKISLISKILENIRDFRLKKKVLFIFTSRTNNNLKKLEKKIFFEMINAYNNMFLLNIIFYEKTKFHHIIDINKIAKKFKL